jgi:hypothetical protein
VLLANRLIQPCLGVGGDRGLSLRRISVRSLPECEQEGDWAIRKPLDKTVRMAVSLMFGLLAGGASSGPLAAANQT